MFVRKITVRYRVVEVGQVYPFYGTTRHDTTPESPVISLVCVAMVSFKAEWANAVVAQQPGIQPPFMDQQKLHHGLLCRRRIHRLPFPEAARVAVDPISNKAVDTDRPVR